MHLAHGGFWATDGSQHDWAQLEELEGSRADVSWASPSPGSLDQPWAEDVFSSLLVRAPSQPLGPGNEMKQS